MDYTEIAMSIMTAVITCAVPVLVAFAVAYGRKAVAAIETSKYAEAYQSLDPIVRDAIAVAASNAVRKAADEATRFGQSEVRPYIKAAATTAVAGLAEATGVRVDLQRRHVDELIDLAVSEALDSLGDLDVDTHKGERSATVSIEPPDVPVYSYDFLANDELGPLVDDRDEPEHRATPDPYGAPMVYDGGVLYYDESEAR